MGIRLTQSAVEILTTNTTPPAARVSQTALEVLTYANPGTVKARVTQTAVEILTTPAPSSSSSSPGPSSSSSGFSSSSSSSAQGSSSSSSNTQLMNNPIGWTSLSLSRISGYDMLATVFTNSVSSTTAVACIGDKILTLRADASGNYILPVYVDSSAVVSTEYVTINGQRNRIHESGNGYCLLVDDTVEDATVSAVVTSLSNVGLAVNSNRKLVLYQVTGTVQDESYLTLCGRNLRMVKVNNEWLLVVAT